MRRASVSAIIFDKKKEKVLLIKRRDVPIWVLPGGGIDENESPEAAAVREVLEESGLNIEIKRKISEYSPINKLARVTHLFEGSVVSGTLTTGSETKDVDFFALNALPSPFFFIHQNWLNDALKNQSDVIKRPLNDVSYFAFFKYFLCHPIRVIRFLLSLAGFPINSK